jgi:hypothetical protein
MVGARFEDCAKWLARGLSIASNGSKWPQHKKAAIKWQLGDSADQLKKLRRSNRWVTPAKRKITAQQSMDCAVRKKKLRRGNRGIAPAKRKIAASKSMDCASQKKKSLRGNQWIAQAKRKNCSAAIGISRRPLQKN